MILHLASPLMDKFSKFKYNWFSFHNCGSEFETPFSRKGGFAGSYRLFLGDKISFFEMKLSFQRPLQNFLWTLRTCSRYLEGPRNIALCVSKKFVTVRHTNQKILTKILKNFSRHEIFSIISFLLYKTICSIWRLRIKSIR